ncbi:MAG: M48 family metallopeptidase [Spirochaetales bacterium]|nr:M48 family metallopeptidase [Spirochaetales bacterium]
MKPGIILVIYVILFSLEFAWETLLSLLNIGHVGRNKSKIPTYILGIVDRGTYDLSVDYTLLKNRYSIVAGFFSSMFVLIIVLSGFLGDLDRWLLKFSFEPYIHRILYVYAIAFLFQVFSLPFAFYSQFFLEEKFGFNKMTLGLFVKDIVKGLVISLVILTPLLFLMFFLVDQTGGLWWLYAFGVYVAFQFLMVFLFPQVIAPLFNKFTPLADGPLREKIFGLSRRLDFQINNIFVMDGSKRSTHSNAYFTGIGRVKRIVLFDTLIKLLNEEELLGVIAHEVGHYKKRHNKLSMAFSFITAFIVFFILSRIIEFPPLFEAFGYVKPSYYAVLVLLLYFSSPVTFLIGPLVSVFSRKMEYSADRFAVKYTGKDGLKKALLSLSRENLTNFTPHPWFSFYHYSHPTLAERISAIEKYKF